MDYQEFQRNEQKEGHQLNNDINIFEYWQVIKKWKKFIAVTVFSVTVVTIIVSLLMTKMYRSAAVILPLSGNSGLSSVVAKIGDIPFISGMFGETAASSDRQIMALLNTVSLTEKVINKLDLMKFLGADSMEEAVRALKGFVNFFNDKKVGTITITATSDDPQEAMDIASAYVTSLQDFINENALTVSKRNRIFIEGQLVQNKRDLLELGRELNEFYKDGRVSDIESRIDVNLGVVDEYGRDSQNFLASYYENPGKTWDLIENQKTRLDKKLQEITVVKNVPQQVYLQYVTLRRELMGKINALLTQQYEMAKINEAKEDLSFQVIDPARKPEQRFSPQRRKMVQMAFLLSLLCSIFFVFIFEYVRKLKASYQKYKKVG